MRSYSKSVLKEHYDEDVEKLIEEDETENHDEKKKRLEDLSYEIKKGAKSFLFEEYIYLTVFIILFGAIVFFFGEIKNDGTFFTTFAFIIGAYTSIICGYIGMMVATSTNAKTAYFAQ